MTQSRESEHDIKNVPQNESNIQNMPRNESSIQNVPQNESSIQNVSQRESSMQNMPRNESNIQNVPQNESSRQNIAQNISQIYLQKSAATMKTQGAPELIAGYTRYQIYSNDAYIYSVSDSFEWLYRVSYHRENDMNITDGEAVFRHISKTDPRLREVWNKRPVMAEGHPGIYEGKKYYLYFYRNHSPHIYVVVPESGRILQPPIDDVSARMYFIYEPKGR